MKTSATQRQLSPSTRDLLAQLVGLAEHISECAYADQLIALLQRIGQTKEPFAIPGLMSFGLSTNLSVRHQARSSIWHLFSHLPVESLPSLDEALRQSWSYAGGQWNGLKSEAIRWLTGSGDSEQLYLALATGHPNGYVRAEAVATLATSSSSAIIPFLLVRLADWVPPVRTAAEAALQSKLTATYAEVFVDCLGLMGRLTANTRYLPEHARWVDDLLRSRECARSIQRGMQSPTRVVRRQSYRLAAENPAFAAKETIHHALGDPDVLIRRWAFNISSQVLSEDRTELMRKAADDRYGPIRHMAFDALLTEPSAAPEDFRPFLLDRSKSIRRACQSVVAKRLGISVPAFYRVALETPNPKAAVIAIMGLAETGGQSDASEIAPRLTSSSARMRRAAVRALHVLGMNGYEESLRQLVRSDLPSVAREAASALLLARAAAPETVWTEALQNPHASVQPGVLRLLRTGGKWLQLRFYLQAATSSDPNLAQCAIELISRWVERFNSTFADTTTAEKRALLEMLAPLRTLLPPRLVRELDFILTTAIA